MKITIKKKSYTLKLGAKALLKMGKSSIDEKKDDWEILVDVAMAAIKESSKPTRAAMDEYLDDNPEVVVYLSNGLVALKSLSLHAKK